MPQVEDCKNQEQNNPWHKYNVLDHILHSVEEMNKQFVAKQQESQYAVHAMRLQSQAINLQKYIQKTGCTLDEAFDFFEIPEGDRKPMAQWIKV